MKLTTLVLGTSLVAGLAGCASTKPATGMPYTNEPKGCFMSGKIRTCTDYIDNGKQIVATSFYRGTVNGNLICGMRRISDGWLSIVDQGCDGITDLYQEGDDGTTKQLQRAEDEIRFRQEFDPMLQKAKEKVWKE